MVPVSLLLLSVSTFIPSILPISDGIVPVILLLERSRVASAVRKPKSELIEPVILLFARDKKVNCCVVTRVGIVPESELELKST
jgi:hypothetical protein